MSDNSGPAYPQPAGPAGFRHTWNDGFGGLSKREAFARSCHAALLGNNTILEAIKFGGNSARVPDRVVLRLTAQLAVAHADALLEALKND